jgi:hypothetical protein
MRGFAYLTAGLAAFAARIRSGATSRAGPLPGVPYPQIAGIATGLGNRLNDLRPRRDRSAMGSPTNWVSTANAPAGPSRTWSMSAARKGSD